MSTQKDDEKILNMDFLKGTKRRWHEFFRIFPFLRKLNRSKKVDKHFVSRTKMMKVKTYPNKRQDED
jgi:hypothetical protein